MQKSIIITTPPNLEPGGQVLVRVYLGEPGWLDGSVEVDFRPHPTAPWTPVRLTSGEAEVRNEGEPGQHWALT